MTWLGFSTVRPETDDKRERVYAQLRAQEQRIRAIDRALAVIQRTYAENEPRVDA